MQTKVLIKLIQSSKFIILENVRLIFLFILISIKIVYSQSQYGWLVRYDKKSGEEVGIKPISRKGELGYKWNWDAPLTVSSHKSGRLYFAANKVFRSDNYGNSWDVISDDLSRKIDRNKLKVYDRVLSMDAVAKNGSTSPYGTIVALSESTLDENLLVVGTDDGLVQITKDGWSLEMKIPYSALRFPEKNIQKWGINFSRAVADLEEWYSWSPVDTKVYKWYESLGIVNGLENIQPPLRLFLYPYGQTALNLKNGSSPSSIYSARRFYRNIATKGGVCRGKKKQIFFHF